MRNAKGLQATKARADETCARGVAEERMREEEEEGLSGRPRKERGSGGQPRFQLPGRFLVPPPPAPAGPSSGRAGAVARWGSRGSEIDSGAIPTSLERLRPVTHKFDSASRQLSASAGNSGRAPAPATTDASADTLAPEPAPARRLRGRGGCARPPPRTGRPHRWGRKTQRRVSWAVRTSKCGAPGAWTRARQAQGPYHRPGTSRCSPPRGPDRTELPATSARNADVGQFAPRAQARFERAASLEGGRCDEGRRTSETATARAAEGWKARARREARAMLANILKLGKAGSKRRDGSSSERWAYNGALMPGEGSAALLYPDAGTELAAPGKLPRPPAPHAVGARGSRRPQGGSHG